MSWQVGHDTRWQRDIGSGVPAECDHPDCTQKIDRGLYYVCGGEPYGGEHGCGLFFCDEHLAFIVRLDAAAATPQLCDRCLDEDFKPPFAAKPDLQEWTDWKMTDPSWAEWRMSREDRQP
jgi:hypothetical protein